MDINIWNNANKTLDNILHLLNGINCIRIRGYSSENSTIAWIMAQPIIQQAFLQAKAVYFDTIFPLDQKFLVSWLIALGNNTTGPKLIVVKSGTKIVNAVCQAIRKVSNYIISFFFCRLS